MTAVSPAPELSLLCGADWPPGEGLQHAVSMSAAVSKRTSIGVKRCLLISFFLPFKYISGKAAYYNKSISGKPEYYSKSISGKPEYCYKSISGKPMVPDVRDFLSPQGCARMRCGRCCPYGQPAGVIPCFAGAQDSRASLEFTDFFQVINIGLSDAFDAPAADYRQFSLRCSGRQGLS